MFDNPEIIKVFIEMGVIGVAYLGFFYFFTKQQKKMLDNLLLKQEKQNESIIKGLERISLNVGKQKLEKTTTIKTFNYVLSHHISKKKEYLKSVLEKNSIQIRKETIKKNIKNELLKITQDEAMFLSQFTTPAGDLGEILLGVDFDKLLKEVYDIFFTEDEIEKKLNDIEALMIGYVNDLERQIRKKITDNF